jgi:MoxR-like ATPase
MALTRIIKASLFTPSPEGFWGLPLFLWGDPGIGKTHLIKALCKRYGLPMERLSPGERGEGQFGVVPVPGADGFLHYPAPSWASRLDPAGVIFLDEANTAPPALQAPLLGLVQLRTLGSHTFGSRVRTIAAANETKHAAGGWDLAPALANRFGHLAVEGLAASEWAYHYLTGFAPDANDPEVDAAAEEARVLEAWPAADAWARGLISGFVTRRPELLHKPPTKGSDTRSWPSRRSVDYAGAALASARVHGLTESETDEFMGAFVGQAWVAEFRHWMIDANLPDPADLLDGRAKFEHDVRRLDRTLAVLSACASLVSPAKAVNRKARAVALWKLIDDVLKDAGDVAIPAARVLVQSQPPLFAPFVPEASKTLVKMSEMLRAAGIVAPGVR